MSPVKPDGFRLATAPVNWNNNDIPGFREVTTFPDILESMAAAGYTATEFDVSFGPDAGPESEARGITYCGCYRWFGFQDETAFPAQIDEARPLLDTLTNLGCKHLIVADALRPDRVALAGRVPEDGSKSPSAETIGIIASNVAQLADAAREHGIQTHYHNHVGSVIESPEEVERLTLALDTSRVDLCFDTGHYAYGGGDPASFIATHADKIGYLHLKDVDAAVLAQAREEQLSFIDALRMFVFTDLGQGTANIPEILGLLRASGYEGWLVVEQDTCPGDPTATARRNREFIEGWSAAKGVTP